MKKKKILVLCPYPKGEAAGQRLKYEQYFNDWEKEGYEITISSFSDINLWRSLYSPKNNFIKILGTLSDGDIRKAILKNFDLTQRIEFIYKKNPYVLLENKFSKKDANKLFLDYKIDLIPIVDKNSKVKDFISWNNFFGDTQKKKELDIPVIIMAGGQGDRLQPFTKVLPKPLIPINDKPIIEHVIENFLKFGIKNYYLSVNFKSRVLKAYFEESKHNYEISFLEEDKPLGTSGSLKLLKKHNLKSFIVTNCDTIIDIDLNDFYEFHKTNNKLKKCCVCL